MVIFVQEIPRHKRSTRPSVGQSDVPEASKRSRVEEKKPEKPAGLDLSTKVFPEDSLVEPGLVPGLVNKVSIDNR